MPKTIEELEAEITQLKAEQAGQRAEYKKRLDTATAHATKLTEDNQKLEKDLDGYRKAERDAWLEKAKAIDKDEDFSKAELPYIKAFVNGAEKAKALLEAKAHSSPKGTKAPPPGGSPDPQKDPLDAFLDS